MIKINKNDSIVDIILKIKNTKEKDIILEFPFGHPVLHNYTSLKILKSKSGKKDLIIITNDQTAKKIGKKLGIKYSLINNSDLIQYNYSFFEYFIYTFKNYFNEIKNIFLQKKEENIIGKYKNKYKNGKIGYFISFLFLSLFLLIFIFYFAVNKTYIYITPEIEVKTKAKNFIFTLTDENEIINTENIIKLKEISKLIYLKNTFGTSGVSEKSISNSRGKVTLFNHFNEQIDLLPNTRLESGSGVIFKIEGNSSIPASIISSTGMIIPGKIDVFAISNTHDNKGKITGIRGNIKKGNKVILPGLKDEKDKIYGIINQDFKGANDNYTKILDKKDIQNAKSILQGKLESEALKELKKEITQKNKNSNTKYEILGINNIIKYSNLEISGDKILKPGDQINSFELEGTIKITSYIYNKEFLLNKIKNSIKLNILKDIEEILQVNTNSLRISDVIWEEKYPNFSVKATTQIEVLFVQNFLNKSSSYVNKLKNIVSGLNKEQAEKILLNNPKISNINVVIRPFFIKKVSKINENIIFKIKRD